MPEVITNTELTSSATAAIPVAAEVALGISVSARAAAAPGLTAQMRGQVARLDLVYAQISILE